MVKTSQKCPTLGECIEKYIEIRSGRVKANTIANYRSIARRELFDWLNLKISAITGKMILDRHRQISERAPTQANRVMMTLSGIFKFSIHYFDLHLSNPTKYLSALGCWNPEKSRKEFYLEMHELGDWMRAVLQLESPDTRDLLIFILLTGCRRSEATQLTWNDVDLRNGIVWIGSQRRGSEYQTKTKNCHKFPLSTLLIELLRQREFSRDSSARVFPVEWPYKSIKTITRRTGITFRTHDLRRTFCNLLTHPAVNADELEVKALMNHVADVTRKHYMTVHVERLRPVMERLSQLVLYETGMPSASRNSSLLLLEDMLDVEVIEESSETLEGELVC